MIWFNPLLPTELDRISLDIRYRGCWMNLAVADAQFIVEVWDWGQGPVRIGLAGEVIELQAGERRQISL